MSNPKIEAAAHLAICQIDSASHSLLMAFKWGNDLSAKNAREHLAGAVATLDAALADQPAPIRVEA